MGDNSFKVREQLRQQNLKERPADLLPESGAASEVPGVVGLPAPKPMRRQYSVYMDVEMMDEVKRLARKRRVPIGTVVETCIKMALPQLEG